MHEENSKFIKGQDDISDSPHWNPSLQTFYGQNCGDSAESEIDPEQVQHAIAVLEAAADSLGLRRLVAEIQTAYRFDRALIEIKDNPANLEFKKAALTGENDD